MFKNLFRAVFALVGAFAGYGAFLLLKYILIATKIAKQSSFGTFHDIIMAGVCVVLFALIFFAITPLLTRKSKKVTTNIQDDLQSIKTTDIIGGTIGLIIGLFMSYLITRVYGYLDVPYLPLILTVITYLVLGYLGVVIGQRKGGDIFGLIVREAREGRRGQQGRGKEKGRVAAPKIMDTSVIIDGRVYDIMRTGFIEGTIVIPDFVLVELRHIADSSDALKRKRGRRGLDVLNDIQEEFGVEIYDTTGEKTLEEIPEVDVKLLKLAQNMNGTVVTNDFNLNKVAGINNVKVLNINELANQLKPIVLPGEHMNVFLIKEGKGNNQGVAYLDDGTMIVVENGHKLIGKQINVEVTSVLQTAAGRMIFAKPAA